MKVLRNLFLLKAVQAGETGTKPEFKEVVLVTDGSWDIGSSALERRFSNMPRCKVIGTPVAPVILTQAQVIPWIEIGPTFA